MADGLSVASGQRDVLLPIKGSLCLLLSDERKRMRGCLINSWMTSHCKCVGGPGKNSNELVKAEVEEAAESSLQLKDRVSPGLRAIAVGWGTTAREQFCKNHPRVTAAHRLHVSQHHRHGMRKATASAWAGQRKKKGEAILPICSGPWPHVHFGVFHLQSLQGMQGGPWAGQSGK